MMDLTIPPHTLTQTSFHNLEHKVLFICFINPFALCISGVVIECLIAKYPTNITHELKLTIRNHFKSNSKSYDDSFIDESNNTFLDGRFQKLKL